jgi:hypothetical protein
MEVKIHQPYCIPLVLNMAEAIAAAAGVIKPMDKLN